MGKYEDASLILKLYDLRRETVMREARSWYLGEFHPGSLEELQASAFGEHSAHYRMVTTYWDMACSFVVNGALDEQMFNDAAGEHIAVYCKIEPFITQIRSQPGYERYMQSLEKVVMNIPNAAERLSLVRERLKQMSATRAAAKQG